MMAYDNAHMDHCRAGRGFHWGNTRELAAVTAISLYKALGSGPAIGLR
jgi:hypothetical protein